jgi:flagellar motor switch protein FliG
MAQCDQFLRKAAVLITLLDDQAVEALLGQMEREQVVRLQRVLGELAPVAAGERSQVIQEFLQAEAAESTAACDSDGVEIDASLAARIASEDSALPEEELSSENAATSPFAFLAGVAPEVLGDLLVREHAQTISIVLSHLPPGTAAEILPRLGSEQRGEVLRRLGQLGPTEDAVVAEIEQELQRLFRRRIPVRAEPAASPAALQAILQIARDADRQAMLAELDAGAAAQRPAEPAESCRDASPPAAALVRPRAVFEFDDLVTLDDSSLARVFRGAEPQAALVALAGAGPTLVDRIRRQLPWREARDLRLQMERLGPIRLSDVERAQQQLADVASRLIQQGVVAPPANRRFVVAA